MKYPGLFAGNWSASQESDDAGSRDPSSDFWFTNLGMRTPAGIRVSPENAMAVAAVFACVRIIAETVGSLPCITYKRLERGKERARDHELYRLLRYQPNELQTATEFFEMMTGHTALRGNAYAEKVVKRGRVEQLIPLHPDCMTPQLMDNGRMHYLYRSKQTGEQYRYLPEEILHLRGFTLDNHLGVSTIAAAAGAIGTARAADDYAARFFANDASPRGVLTHPSHFADKERRETFRKSWQSAQTGQNRHKTAILEDGMKYEQLGLSAADAQLIESRRYQIADIARFFRMPLVLLGETEKSTSWGSGIEQFVLAFVTHTMRPWFVRWEQRLRADLIDDAESGDDEYFVEFLIDALLRGDMKTRYESYSKGINDGWLLRNEARDRENLNPLPGLDEPLQPLNMGRAGEQPKGPKSEPGPRQDEDDVEARASQVVRKEVAALSRLIERSVGKGRDAFLASVRRFYGTQVGYVSAKLKISADLAREICDAAIAEIEAANVSGDQEIADVADCWEAWEPSRARELAHKVRTAYAP